MPNQETNVRTLKINRLTEAQYDAAIKNDAELYLTPDDTDIEIATHNSDNTAHSAAFTNRIDNSSITMNSSSKMQASGVKDVRTSNTLKTWTGTRAQYEAIATKDANTLYNITDDTDATASLLDLLYPVGAVYIGTMDVCPLATLGIGTWELVAADRVLQGAGTRGSVGTTINESLPNIKGSISSVAYATQQNGALIINSLGGYNQSGSSASLKGSTEIKFDASNSSSIYQDDAPVQQDAYLVNIWRRTA